MKTVAILYSGGPQWGGIETYLLNLFRLNDRQRLDLVLISMGAWELTRAVAGGPGNGAAVRPGAPAAGPPRVRVLSGRRVRPRTIWEIRRVLKQEEAALLVSQGVVANAYARAAAAFARVPSLVVVHSDLAAEYPRPLARWSYMLVDRALRRATKHYIAVARYLKDRLAASGVDPGRVRVIHNGVDWGGGAGAGRAAGATEPMPAGGSEQVGAEPGTRAGASPPEEAARGITLVSLGRLHPVKNFGGLIEAMRFLPEEVRLEIWGDGPEKQRLEALIAAWRLGSRVKLCGQADGIYEALSRADVYVQPSESEGCSFAVAEAMLHCKPVVVTPRGGLLEQVEDGCTGVVAAGVSAEALAAAVMRVVGDTAAAAHLARAGQISAEEKFSLDVWLEKTISALAEAAR